MSDALVTQLARVLNLPPDAARHTLNHLVATLREQLDATGQAQVPGLGTFRHDEDGLSFQPDAGLARAVNHRYAGLRPIEAGPSSAWAQPEPAPDEELGEEEPTLEEEAPPEVDDPFAEASPEEPAETELPETAVGFQPLESFLEPEEPEEAGDEFEPQPPDAFEQVRPGAPPPEPPPEDSPTHETAAETPAEEPEIGEDYDDLLAGTWTEGSETPEDEHVLGALPPDDVEEADYDLVEPDEPDLAPPVGETDWNEEWEEDLAFDEEGEPEDADEPPAPSLPAEPPPVDAAAPPEPEAEPEPEPPAEPRTVAPAVAATAGTPTDRAPTEPARRRGIPTFVTVIGIALVLGVIALLWLLNREPERPDVTERPVPADTAVVAETPPADTLAAAVPTDTAAAVAEAPPEPEEPAASADPLRSAVGIDPAAGGFTWVVASELDRAAAERRVARYREQGLRADVVAEEAGGRTRYRVSLGQFGSVAEAEARRADLPVDVPPDSWILRL